MPAVFKIEPVQLVQVNSMLVFFRPPVVDVHTPGAAYRLAVSGQNLDGEVIQTGDARRMWIDAERHAELALLARVEHALSAQSLKALVAGFLFLHLVDCFQRQNLDGYFVAADLFYKLPLVKREVPVPLVDDDLARPVIRINNPDLGEKVRQPVLYLSITQAKFEHAPARRGIGEGDFAQRFQIAPDAALHQRGIIKQMKVGHQS